MKFVVAGCLVVLFASVQVAAAVVTVTPDDLAGWQRGPFLSPCSSFPATMEFVSGPAGPPLGSGSLQIGIDPTSPFLLFYSHAIDGEALTTISELRYSTFVSSSSMTGIAPRLVLTIATGEIAMPFDQLVFIPRLQDGLQPGDAVPVQGPVVTGAWQSWNALAGGWQSAFASPVPPLTTLASYAAAHPSARILEGDPFGGLAISAGCDGSALQANVDAVAVQTSTGSTVFDFELTAAAADDVPMSSFGLLVMLAALLAAVGLWRAR